MLLYRISPKKQTTLLLFLILLADVLADLMETKNKKDHSGPLALHDILQRNIKSIKSY
jgi:hypothetical protein